MLWLRGYAWWGGGAGLMPLLGKVSPTVACTPVEPYNVHQDRNSRFGWRDV